MWLTYTLFVHVSFKNMRPGNFSRNEYNILYCYDLQLDLFSNMLFELKLNFFLQIINKYKRFYYVHNTRFILNDGAPCIVQYSARGEWRGLTIYARSISVKAALLVFGGVFTRDLETGQKCHFRLNPKDSPICNKE